MIWKKKIRIKITFGFTKDDAKEEMNLKRLEELKKKKKISTNQKCI
jgi:hypothetical protein